MTIQYALTTVDNPYDPFDEFDQWLAWDSSNGYDTSGYMGRIVHTSGDLSDADEAFAISEAIDEVLYLHGNTFYKKVSHDDGEEPAYVMLDGDPVLRPGADSSRGIEAK
jgi:hypothetical protein